MSYIKFEDVPFYSQFAEIFYHEWVLNFVKEFFSAYSEVIFFSVILLCGKLRSWIFFKF